jgi:hypothetical protein
MILSLPSHQQLYRHNFSSQDLDQDQSNPREDGPGLPVPLRRPTHPHLNLLPKIP